MINFPTNIRVSKRSENACLPNSKPDSTSPLVLIISETEDTRVLFTTLLGCWGYRVAALEKTKQFNKVFKRRTPDLVIMDLPKFYDRGLADFCDLRKLKRARQIPVIFLSGYSQPNYRRAAMELGADDFLVKPVDFDHLEELLRKFSPPPLQTPSRLRRFEAEPHASLISLIDFQR
jgi:DNA-binding NtrC family response regulator